MFIRVESASVRRVGESYMIGLGITVPQMRTVGYGQGQLVAVNMIEAGRYQNRRVGLLSLEFELTAEK